jgi:transposase-like protein
MGSNLSKIKERHGVNYHCPICKSTKKVPNLVGKFIQINDNQFKCIGCNSIFNKDIIYSLSKNNEPITFEHVIKV